MQNRHLLTLGLLAATLAGGSSLSALDVSYGVQAGAGLPTGDLKTLVNSQVGYTLGGFALLDLKGGHAIRPRLDWAHFQGSHTAAGTIEIAGNDINYSGKITTKTDSVALGADYLYFFQGGIQDGFYVLAGLGTSYNKITLGVSGTVSNGSGSMPYNQSASANSTNLYGNLGVGYQITPQFGVEARFNATQYKNSQTESNASNWGSAIVAVSYRF